MENVSRYFEEYSGNSSIHGVKFVGDRKRSIFERLLWLLVVSVSVVICTDFMLTNYNKWSSSPVYVTIGTTQLPIHNIAFPAVTICPEAKTDINKFNFGDAFNKILKDNADNFTQSGYEYMSTICNRTSTNRSNFLIDSFDTEMLYFLHNVSSNFSDVFLKCKFSGNAENCDSVFTRIFTRDGVCFTFNILDRAEMYRDNVQQFLDYNTASNSVCFNEPYTTDCENVYPKRASFSGTDAGLEVELRTYANNIDLTCSIMQGYKVFIHDPSEMPTYNHHHFRVSLNEAVFASLTPEVILTKKELRSYPAQKRQCYLDDEKKLSRFNFYTQSNCFTECFAYIMDNLLECLDFYIPSFNYSNNICSAQYMVHVRLLEKLLISYISNSSTLNLSEFEKYIKENLNHSQYINNITSICNCFPSCTSVQYKFETTQTPYYWHQFNDKSEVGYSELHSLLTIYFKEGQYIPLERDEMFGMMDFIAYCGGLLGLFIGFSFISLLEIIYFLTLRICCNVRIFGRKYWYGSED